MGTLLQRLVIRADPVVSILEDAVGAQVTTDGGHNPRHHHHFVDTGLK
jgi:hypothetical protein